MEMNTPSNAVIAQQDIQDIPDTDRNGATLRANTYGLLASLLAKPAGEELLQRLSAIEVTTEQESSGIAGTWPLLKLAAEHSNVKALDDEFHDLFIGVGCGELVPYASWYLSGYMMDKPLALLREDLRVLGFERPPEITEPEDHAATLCEVMAALIQSEDVNQATQRYFFTEHMAPWMGAFFGDLQEAESAVFYRAVGRLGREFIALEQRYLSMRV